MPEQNSNNPFSMPGPQFGFKPPQNSSWFKKNQTRIIVGAILLICAIGFFSIYQNYRNRAALLKPTVNDIRADIAKISSAANTSNVEKIIPAGPIEKEKTESTIVNANGKIIISPIKGDGLTHLARRALKEYLRDNPELAQKLKTEHKIFIEDYLRKNLTDAPHVLQTGDTVAFSRDFIQDAIDRAQKLTDSQLNNLSKYVVLVPSLSY